MADGVVTDSERDALMGALQAASGVSFAETGCVTAETIAFSADDCDVEFEGNTFCLTGQFLYGSRGACEAATTAACGVCVGSVTKKTRYLVIGSAGATKSWKHATYGQNIDSAMKLKELGHSISVITEEVWSSAILLK